MYRSTIAALAAFAAAACASAEAPFTPSFDPLDSMSPKSTRENVLAKPLQTVTLSTNSMEQIQLFYVDGMGMTLTGPVEASPELKAQQRALWAVPDALDWAEYHLTRPEASIQDRGAMSIRVLAFDTPTPTVHKSWDSRGLGGFSMGFPNRMQPELDTKIRRLGYGAINPISIYDVPRTDGTMYTIHETIFNGPDFVHAVGIDRLGMSSLGAVDEETKLGGPGYSAMVIEDSDTVLAFFTDVLGLELRRDNIWKSSGEDGAMALPNGTEFRFTIVAAPGHGPGGHMLFVDFTNIEPLEANAPPRVPNRGIGMWSFPVTDLDAVLANAESFGSEMVHAPTLIADPLHGDINVATLLAPNGLLIEVFEEAAP